MFATLKDKTTTDYLQMWLEMSALLAVHFWAQAMDMQSVHLVSQTFLRLLN